MSGIRRSKAWFRWIVAGLILVSTPFLWLLARDALLVFRAEDDAGKKLAHSIIADRLAATVEDSEMAAEARRPLGLTIILDPACFELADPELKPRDLPAPADADALESIFFAHQSLSERAIFQLARAKLMSDRFTTREASMLNACMQATPFANWCGRTVSTRTRDIFDRSNQMAVEWGTKRIKGQANDPSGYCYTMPAIVRRSEAQ